MLTLGNAQADGSPLSTTDVNAHALIALVMVRERAVEKIKPFDNDEKKEGTPPLGNQRITYSALAALHKVSNTFHKRMHIYKHCSDSPRA